MNEMKAFESEQFGRVRTIDELFVASDVAKALGYRMASDMTRRLDEDEKDTRSVRTPSGEQEMTVITESGLYNAVIGSQLPAAKEFKRWITHEVIPSIRKHGAYMTPDLLEQAIVNPDLMIGLLYKLKEHQAEIAAQGTYIKALEPKADFYDAVAGSKTAIDIGNAAKVLEIPGIGRNKLFEILRDLEILNDRNIPYQAYIDRGYFRVVEQKYGTSTGETRINFKTLVYQRGLDYIRKAVKKLHETA